MSSYHLVNVWTDAEPGPAAFSPMTDSMLWLPDDFRPGHPVPAFIYVGRWGGYTYDALPASLGPQLADAGFPLLSLSLRRRGMEGQLAARADDDLRDIKLGIDYLHATGCRQVFLLGHEMGGHSVLRYLQKHGDTRIAGLCWYEPQENPATWLQQSIGAESYREVVHSAGISVRQGAGMDVRVDLFPDKGPAITQNALAFLNWWGPSADFDLTRSLEAVRVPLRVLVPGSAAAPAALVARAEAAAGCDIRQGELVGDELVSWAVQHGAGQLERPGLDMLRAESAGAELFALLWRPADAQPGGTAILLMHGLTSSPLSPLFQRMAPVLVQSGAAVLAIETRRSGWAGHESALAEYDSEDLDLWITRLLELGYEKIVLAGASMGSISVGRYQSLHQHPNVVAIAHLMPTADCPDWFRAAAGAGPYEQAAAQAKAAVAAGQGATALIDVDVRQPPPNRYGGRFRWTQRAASWLSWWGPDADTRNTTHIANARVPLLLLSGTEDSYNDSARFAELRAAAANAPSVDEIWYPDVDHGLAGVEAQVAADLMAWLRKLGAV